MTAGSDPRGSARARIQRRQLAVIVLVACVVTPVFNVLTDRATIGAAIQGLVDGILIPLLVGGYLLFVRDGLLREWFRRFSFGANLAISGTIVLVLFLVGRAAGQVVRIGDPRRFMLSFTDAHLVYALPFFVVLAFAIQFVLQMNRMIGASVLRYFVAGVYHRPRAEERIFLFLDLADSTALAERLGSARYFELLRRAVDGLTVPIVEAQGGDLPVRWRRGCHHVAAREGRQRGQLYPVLLPGQGCHCGCGRRVRARLRRRAALSRRPPRRHRHRG